MYWIDQLLLKQKVGYFTLLYIRRESADWNSIIDYYVNMSIIVNCIDQVLITAQFRWNSTSCKSPTYRLPLMQ